MAKLDAAFADLQIEIVDDIDVAWCSRECMRFAKRMGFDEIALWSIGITTRELTSNVLKFAKRGTLTLRRIITPRIGVELLVEDVGPGIEDLEKAMTDSFSEGRFLNEKEPEFPRRGLGAGLGAVKRMMSELVIESRTPGSGTRIIVRKWLNEIEDNK